MKGATLFGGFEGVGLAMEAAGIEHAWSVENDPDIAAVAQENGFNVTVADVMECDPNDFEPIDVLHASPPCPNFSQAKTNGKESDQDVALAAAVCWFVTTLQPSVVTLENVYMYRKSVSFRWIAKVLRAGGYHVRWWHLNAADYGVPQSRKRLIMAAARDFVPQRPPATHAPPEEIAPAFDDRKLWVGWYEAIEDLIPELPDSEFAPWQLERLPEELKTMLMSNARSHDQKGNEYGMVHRDSDDPSTTIRPTAPMNAFILSNAKTEWGDGQVDGEEPALSVTQQHKGRLRAFVMSSHSVNGGEPARRDDDEPAITVDTKEGRVRAFIAPGGNANSFSVRDADEPTRVIGGTERVGNIPRAYTQGRVVRMTPRALARFQSFPDSYTLPEKKTLACRGVGNAVPPLLMQKLYKSLLEQHS